VIKASKHYCKTTAHWLK